MNEEPTRPDDEDLLEQLREMPVGTTDPNIVGEAGPTDVPPGADPPRTPLEPSDEDVPPDPRAAP